VTQASAPSDSIILETHGLTKEFRGFVAVKNVDLKVRRFTIHALIGPNGAGKTTCFNLLTHFLTPTAGRIRFNGYDITGSRPADIARLGLVRSFDAVGLGALAATPAVELPYGRKRALEIATTLALEPEMMLLDEPTAGMAHEDVGRISALIKKVAVNRTVLMVEHNLSVVENLSHTITVLARGEVLAEGDYATVSRNPQVIQAYMGSADG
jgi:branched-chain amino acid transport system ATP-binding protein